MELEWDYEWDLQNEETKHYPNLPVTSEIGKQGDFAERNFGFGCFSARLLEGDRLHS